MSNMLVIGGSGFVGSHLIAELKRRGHDVWNYDIAEGQDILDKKMLREQFARTKPKEVYHLAGSVVMIPAEEDPREDLLLNCMGTLNVIELCKEYEAKLLFTGTGASYGIGATPHRENSLPMSVCNYGISKFAAENYIRKEVWVNGLKGVIVRFSSVYGDGRGRGPVNIFTRQAREQGFMTVYGPGNQTRDIVHYSDAIRGMLLAMQSGEYGEIYNVGSGKETSVVEIAWMIHELTGAEVKHVDHEESLYDLPRSWFDISKLQALGYEPLVDLKGGIKELLGQ